ncbi:MAG: GDSL-type esterase/lipase family protein [Flavobacteriales bacterium]|nr:GDSL-type esterase/lipase family protein [Flavobacteriales bacterium]MCX7767768.1 GDSL-type esterase/lipase family protein [Flavobacteriales bacterium]MDW8410289.1 GDSL-type esterase/lipase family protein [Flavobacteriales bacterium]
MRRKRAFLYSLGLGMLVSALSGWPAVTAAQSCPEGYSFPITRFRREIRDLQIKYARIPKGAVVFYGSSSIRRWGTLRTDFAPLPVVNCGFGGATLKEMNYYFRQLIAPLKPSILVAYGGENDLAHPLYCLDSVQARFRQFLRLCDAYLPPQCPVVFVLIKNSPKRAAFRSQFEEFNAWVKQEAVNHPRLYLFDGDKVLQAPDGGNSHLVYGPDSLHLGPEGYRRWTEGLKPLLLRLYASAEVPAKP